jgi:hypothetical protein
MADKDFRVKLGLHVGANAYIEGNITSVDRIQMNVASPTAVGGAGQLSWNIDDNTIDVGMNAVTTLQLGQESYYYVKNHTASTIPDGTVVMANGTNGASGRIHVEPAVANGSIPSKYILGLTTEDIAAGADGFVTTFGKIRKLNTSMFSEGDILYANPAVPGGLANTVPVAPNNIVTVAIVINKHANNGTMFVRPTYGSNIHENEDVHTEGLSDGQALVYVAANARFENKTVAAAQSNSFTTISVSGQSNVVADSSSDTLTLAAGSGIQLTTDAATDTITITNTGGSGGAGLIAGDYVVRAAKNGSTQTVTSGSDVVVTLVDDIDPQGWWTPNKFQPTIAGYYSLTAQIWLGAGTINNNQTNLQLRKNGSTQIAIAQTPVNNSTVGEFLNLSTIAYFNGTTDYVEVTFYTTNPTSQDINGATTGTWFTAALYAYGDAANTWVNANDYSTLLSARSNDFNTLQTAYSNDYSTLLSARSNDYATLLSAYANDFALYSSVRSFNAFVVAGQSDVVADAFTDTVTLAAGSGIVITTDAPSDTITIANIGPRLVYVADATSITVNADITDIAQQNNTQAVGTLTVNAPTGTITDSEKFILRIRSTNIQTFSWNGVFAGSTDGSLPTATTGSSKTDYMGFMYMTADSKWHMIAKNFGF